MKSTDGEKEEAIKIVEEKLHQAAGELSETFQAENKKRMQIHELEKKYEESLEMQKVQFEQKIKGKFELKNNVLNDLNSQLQEAMKNNDRSLIQEIMQKMSQL